MIFGQVGEAFVNLKKEGPIAGNGWVDCSGSPSLAEWVIVKGVVQHVN